MTWVGNIYFRLWAYYVMDICHYQILVMLFLTHLKLNIIFIKKGFLGYIEFSGLAVAALFCTLGIHVANLKLNERIHIAYCIHACVL